MPGDVVIGTIGVGVREQLDCRVVFLSLTLPMLPYFDSHVNTSELKAHVVGGLDGVILVAHSAEVVKNILPRRRRRSRISPSLDEHLFKLHKDVGVEPRQTQYRDHGGNRRRGTALLLQTLLRGVEGLGNVGAECMVDHPPHGRQRVQVDAHHVDGVLHMRFRVRAHVESLQIRRLEDVSFVSLHEDVDCVEVGRQREGTVDAHVGVLRGRHLVDGVGSLTMSSPRQTHDVSAQHHQTVATQRQAAREEVHGGHWKQHRAVLRGSSRTRLR